MGILFALPVQAADKDGDGMSDDWEIAHQLDPIDPNDADDDPDYDLFTNLEEFARKGDPHDENSPERTYYVAKTGSNSNAGSRKFPWLTITNALRLVHATEKDRVRIIIAGGVYEENLRLTPYVTVTGYYTVPTGPDSKGPRPTYTGILGNHTGAPGAALKDLYLRPGDPSAATLTIDDVSMVVTNCVFVGPDPGVQNLYSGIGIRVLTDDAVGTLIEKSDFRELDKGIEVTGDFPLIRQCFFEDLDVNAIALVGGRTFGTINLGKADDPTTGFNSFDINSIAGPIISGNWQGSLRMENNTWNTTDLGHIADVLSDGLDSFDFDPPGDTTTYSLIPASIFCTVTNGESDLRVEDALVLIQPAIFAPVSDNIDGVYSIPAVLPGSYTVQALAPSYESQSKSVSIQASEIEAVLFELERFSSADTDQNNQLTLGELLRLIQFYNTGSYHCQTGTEDGYSPGSGSHNCTPHSSDYTPQNWAISLSEILRAIQFYNSGGYVSCPENGTEDGFCPN